MRKVKNSSQMKAALAYGMKKADADFSKLMRESVLKSKGAMDLLTPVDTGWASKPWSIGMNRTTEDETVVNDDIAQVGPGDVVTIFNNVPYIKRLDEGWSQQRPLGFTHMALDMAQIRMAKLTSDLSVEVYKDV